MFKRIKCSEVYVDPDRIRRSKANKNIKKLAESMKILGQLHPIPVKPL